MQGYIMGYRSNGKLYMKQNVYNMLTEPMKEDLTQDWGTETTSFENDGYMIYSFSDWKWYRSYEDIAVWVRFFDSLEQNPEEVDEDDWDFLVVGEDNAIVEDRTQTHLYVSSTIEVF